MIFVYPHGHESVVSAEPLVRTVRRQELDLFVGHALDGNLAGARPRIDGMTIKRYGPTGTWRWPAGLSPASSGSALKRRHGFFPEVVELALEESERVGIGQSQQAPCLSRIGCRFDSARFRRFGAVSVREGELGHLVRRSRRKRIAFSSSSRGYRRTGSAHR